MSIVTLLLASPATFVPVTAASPHVLSATSLPSTSHVVHGLTAVAAPIAAPPTSATPVLKDHWTRGGYGQVDSAHHIVGGVDGWIVPKTTCDPSNSNPQSSAFLAWLDFTKELNNAAGIIMVCGLGQTGPAKLYLWDGTGMYYSGISQGDQITVLVADYDGSHTVFYMVDWTTGGYVEDFSGYGSFAHTDFRGIVYTYIYCATPTEICPQVNFHKVLDGEMYDNAKDVACALNPDSTTPAYPCVGYGHPLSGSTYFYAIGDRLSGVTDVKYILDHGDTGVGTVFTKTGRLQSDNASHIYKFLLA